MRLIRGIRNTSQKQQNSNKSGGAFDDLKIP